LDGLRVDELRSNPAMLSPINRTSSTWSLDIAGSLPLVTIRGRGDGAATKYRLTLHEILLATREDRAVGNQQVLGNARIRNYNKQLVAQG
jgi:hypothetical protein